MGLNRVMGSRGLVVCLQRTRYKWKSCKAGFSSMITGKWSDDIYSNPIQELQPMLQVPITSLVQDLFNPSKEEIEEGRRIFRCQEHDIVINKAEIKAELLPELKYPEVCFLGRSNVGKSSLMKALFSGHAGIGKHIKVSRSPGFTRSLKLIKVRKSFSLVDMPGYGYNMPPKFVDIVEGYLQTRGQLTRVFLLIDGNVGFQNADQLAIEMLEEFGRPYTVIMTKIDKSTPHRTLRNVMEFTERCKKMPCCFPQPFLISGHRGYGLAYLQAYIAYVAGNLAVKGS